MLLLRVFVLNGKRDLSDIYVLCINNMKWIIVIHDEGSGVKFREIIDIQMSIARSDVNHLVDNANYIVIVVAIVTCTDQHYKSMKSCCSLRIE